MMVERLLGTSTAGADLRDWRHGQLRRAGVPPAIASALADDPRIDLHAVIQLLERGCPPRLAARIVAPLDEPGNADDDPRG
jgi:hypothetical protein